MSKCYASECDAQACVLVNASNPDSDVCREAFVCRRHVDMAKDTFFGLGLMECIVKSMTPREIADRLARTAHARKTQHTSVLGDDDVVGETGIIVVVHGHNHSTMVHGPARVGDIREAVRRALEREDETENRR